MVLSFWDACEHVTITMWVEQEDDAWRILADNYGSAYAFENFTKVNEEGTYDFH